MTQEEFIEVLNMKGYSYKIEGDKLVVTHEDDVFLGSLTSLPPGVEFKNRGGVDLRSLQTLPPGMEFKNRGNVDLQSLKTLPPGVEFKNRGNVYLSSLETISPGVEFKNGDFVYLRSLIGGWFHYWDGSIEGIEGKIKGVDGNNLLNLMIKRGLFI